MYRHCIRTCCCFCCNHYDYYCYHRRDYYNNIQLSSEGYVLAAVDVVFA